MDNSFKRQSTNKNVGSLHGVRRKTPNTMEENQVAVKSTFNMDIDLTNFDSGTSDGPLMESNGGADGYADYGVRKGSVETWGTNAGNGVDDNGLNSNDGSAKGSTSSIMKRIRYRKRWKKESGGFGSPPNLHNNNKGFTTLKIDYLNGRNSIDSSCDSKGESLRSGGSSWTWGSSFKTSWKSSKQFNGGSQESFSDLNFTRSSKDSHSRGSSSSSWKKLFSQTDSKSYSSFASGSSGNSHGSKGRVKSFFKRFVPNKKGRTSNEFSRGSGDHSSGLFSLFKSTSNSRNSSSFGRTSSSSYQYTGPSHSHDRGSFGLPRVSERKFSIIPSNLGIVKVLGIGAFGKVFLVDLQLQDKKRKRHRKKKANKLDQGLLALKVVQKKKVLMANAVSNATMELQVFKEITEESSDCPFVVKLHDAFQSPTRLFMVMDYASGGELFFHLSKSGTFSLNRARLYFLEIALALAHLHSIDIVYRDLKSENVLIDSKGHVKLTDFGLCKRLVLGTHATTLCGTANYAAPEAIRGYGYGKEVDWWALGVLLFEMLVGGAPFHSPDIQQVYTQICFTPIMIPLRVADKNARSMIERLLVREPTERLGYGQAQTGGDIVAIQLHPFIRSEFEDINDVKLQRVVPEFIPQCKDDRDTANFDAQFTNLPKQLIEEMQMLPLVESVNNNSGKDMDVDRQSGEQPQTDNGLTLRPLNVEIQGFRWVDEPAFPIV